MTASCCKRELAHAAIRLYAPHTSTHTAPPQASPPDDPFAGLAAWGEDGRRGVELEGGGLGKGGVCVTGCAGTGRSLARSR
eukprot:CAMPEP_0184386828 /NCGR_PEP_ID=MMETSP0007-20130409/10166_1 /TAXON_ID=97485 /ORGANISM="Prymnesium parvum, Strain Texoma1" /LENGTH=80 /DNA_ID=CAMNT_0026734893 /DNA_START=302 /DNA_END=542 /DNA_ORIENTATION=-